MNLVSARRIVLTSLSAMIVLALSGLTLGWVRFGWTDAAMAARLEEDVRRVVHARSAAVVSVAHQVAAEAALVESAAASREQLSTLFDRLRSVTTDLPQSPVAATVYVPATTGPGHRVLAWTDGPSDELVSRARLEGAAALFVAQGHAGLRLVAVEPIAIDGRRVAMAVAETVLAPIDRTVSVPDRRMATRYGPVSVIEHDAGITDTAESRFVVGAPNGPPLIEVRFDPYTLVSGRLAFQYRTIAAALLPLPIGLALLLALRVHGRARLSTLAARWRHLATIAMALAVVTGSVMAIGWLADVPGPMLSAVAAVGLLVFVTHVPPVLWWQAGRRPVARVSWGRFIVEHAAGGIVLALAFEGIARVLDRWMTLSVLDRGPFVLVPFSIRHTMSTGTVLLIETSIAWLAASLLMALAIRWRVLAAPRRSLVLAILWLLPTAALPLVPWSSAGRSGSIAIVLGALAVWGSLAAVWLRSTYRHATPSQRLLFALLAGLVPLVLLYPLAAVTADRAAARIIETSYAPAAASHPQELREELRRAQQRIDDMEALVSLVGAMPSADSQAAFFVWNQTGLERSRVISDVSLYGPERTLVSRFAFNLPEYVYRTTLQPWQGSSCAWEVFGEVTPFGSEQRLMLHAERGVCDSDGRLLGGIVVHVASNDYQALPFVSSLSPYHDVLGGSDSGPRLPDTILAVYGWSSQLIFTSGRTTWSASSETLDRLYRTGEPFWTRLSVDDGIYRVHFSQNRGGVYAIGYPSVAWIEHATRLAEIAVLVAVCFVVWQIALLIVAALAARPDTSLRRLYREVRTSFYRKLFLSFVCVAVVPVLAMALAFGGYMTARFRADVEYEASTTVTVAHRVFQELTAAGERSLGLDAMPSDDMMVWIRQVVGHDVNLFDGPDLVMTSQRDLFDLGFLPLRTPAVAYRAVALDRRPSVVAEDRIGTFSYVVAAAPVNSWGRDAVITVPLAPRQREMERALDTLNRRVLVGAVFVVLLAAGVGASLARRISDPVARLTRATQQIAAGRLDVRVATDTADELRRLVDDFNSMAATLGAQRAELARTHQLKAWNEMARQVAHEIKNPLTPVQLAAEHLQHVHEDRGRPLGTVLDRCVTTILTQVRLLRQIASEFANFAGEPVPRPAALDLEALVHEIINPYRVGLGERVSFDVQIPAGLPRVWADRTLTARALTNLVENAVQAMPAGGSLQVSARTADGRLVIELVDTGVGMDPVDLSRAFEPYFSTKTGGSGLGLANARRNLERQGGTVTMSSQPGRGTTVTVTLPVAAPPSEPI